MCDLDDFDPCENCDLDPEECGRESSDCAWELAEEYYEQRREC